MRKFQIKKGQPVKGRPFFISGIRYQLEAVADTQSGGVVEAAVVALVDH